MCQGRGFICEVCEDNTAIFPFELATVRVCGVCGSCTHYRCPLRHCTRCKLRRQKRQRAAAAPSAPSTPAASSAPEFPPATATALTESSSNSPKVSAAPDLENRFVNDSSFVLIPHSEFDGNDNNTATSETENINFTSTMSSDSFSRCSKDPSSQVEVSARLYEGCSASKEGVMVPADRDTITAAAMTGRGEVIASTVVDVARGPAIDVRGATQHGSSDDSHLTPRITKRDGSLRPFVSLRSSLYDSPRVKSTTRPLLPGLFDPSRN